MSVIKLHKIFLERDGLKLLQNITWHVQPGEHWAVMGENGSGKSLLLKMLAGYLYPSQGQIEILGEKLGQTYLPALRKQIGWVAAALLADLPQDISIKEAVLAAFFGHWRLFQKPTPALTLATQNLLREWGLLTIQNRVIQKLSIGERQRMLIARAMALNPKILILDEPCTGLDPKARKKLLDLLQKKLKRKDAPTLIYVTHHIEELPQAISHLLFLKKGQIKFQKQIPSKQVLTKLLE